jgi:ABC-type Fe3+/spermidine/putrescine transport system ATPase subunit
MSAETVAATTLAVRGITMRFDGVFALEDITFDAHAGEVLGVMGPNGASKTTLFNCISSWGLTVRESVEVALSAREFGGTYPPSPLRAMIACGLGLPRRRRADALLRERADALLAQRGLSALADRPTSSRPSLRA